MRDKNKSAGSLNNVRQKPEIVLLYLSHCPGANERWSMGDKNQKCGSIGQWWWVSNLCDRIE